MSEAITAERTVPKAHPDTVIRAAAGTGKTFQLSNRYLRLLNAGELPEHILATTFTRKAAGEILERILVRLAEAALDDRKCRELAVFIDAKSLARSRCVKLLEQLTRQLHRVRVSTLDSFFAQVASSFGLELGLPPGWRIISDLADGQLRSQAIDTLLSLGETTDVARMMNLLTKGEASRSVSELIESTVSKIYDVYQHTTVEAWRKFPPVKLLSSEELRRAIHEFPNVPLPTHKTIDRIHNEACDHAAKHDWEPFIVNGLTKRVLKKETTYYNKELGPELTSAYDEMLEHARGVIIGLLAKQTEATHDLLDRFNAYYSQLKHDAHALLFSDITRLLASSTLSRRSTRFGFRMDSNIHHLLLDEFQDTSLDQWQVLQPFAERVVNSRPASQVDDESDSLGRSLFCVGDVKQAIYGWRGGIAEVFDALTQQLPGISQESLTRSYRSSQPIIDIVNQVFNNIHTHTELEELSDAVTRWQQQFETHTTACTELSGYGCLMTAPQSEEGTSQINATVAFAADKVVELVSQAPGRSVGVLVRRNKIVGHLIYELRRRGIAASEEAGNLLTDSAAVQTVLSLLTFADHPGNTAARFHMAQSPLGPVVGLVDFNNDQAAQSLANDIRNSLMQLGYGPTLDKWAKKLGASCNAREWRRLQQLVKLAYSYELTATVRPSDFVRHVEFEKVSDPTDADVRVMSVHQAKGLEFDIVVLPDLDPELVGQQNSFVVGRPSPTDPIDRVSLYRNLNIQRIFPDDLREMFQTSVKRSASEELCVLYVSLTRAVHALYLIIPPSSPSEHHLRKSAAGLLRAALTNGEPVGPNQTLYETGDREWFQKLPNEDRKQEICSTRADVVTQTFAIKLAPMPTGRSRGLDRTAPSSQEGGTKVTITNVLRQGNAAAMERGTLIHAWFEQIEWLDTAGWPSDATLRRVADEIGATTRLDVDRILAEFHAMLKNSTVAWVLMQKSYQPPRDMKLPEATLNELAAGSLDLEVHNERRFATRINQTVVSGSIDRLVIMYRNLKPVAADIIDFKTDALTEQSSAEEKVEFYRGQLQSYRPAVSQVYQIPEERVSARLVMVSAGIVFDV